MTKNKEKQTEVQEEIISEDVEQINELIVDEIQENQENLEVNESKEKEYLELLQRTQAEFDNYRKRTQTEYKKAQDEGIILAVKQFLPVLDSLYNAEKQKLTTFIEENHLIINQINKALEDLQVKKIEAMNTKFDYNLHQAILTETLDDVEEDMVTEVYQEGYMYKDRIIRHSVVKVNKKS